MGACWFCGPELVSVNRSLGTNRLGNIDPCLGFQFALIGYLKIVRKGSNLLLTLVGKRGTHWIEY